MAVTDDRGHSHQRLAKGLNRLESLAFLNESDDRVDKHDTEDHSRIDPVIEQRRNHHGSQQDVDQRLVELK